VQILIVDDEPVELFLAKKILNMEFKAEGFNTLPEALQWAKTNSFDVLLSDYYLDKQLHAIDVLRTLLDLKGKSFKSFVLTNFIDESKVAEIISAGFNGVIEKPLTLEKFKSKVGL
jgi:CheY-like chemotaxis protein